MKVLDTSVMIDLDRNSAPFLKSVRQLENEDSLILSSVSIFEFWWGMYLSSLKKRSNIDKIAEFTSFVSGFDIVPVDFSIAKEAATIGVNLRLQGQTIDLHDLYIASTAKIIGAPLVTANLKHFEQIEGLQTIAWPI